jgi:YVTN family beta-propeller protein
MSLNLPVWRANLAGVAPLATAAPGVPTTTFQSVRAAVRRVRARIPTLAELVVGDIGYDVPLHTPVAAPPPPPLGAVGVGAFPTGIAVSPEGTHVYVVNSGDDSVSAIDADTGTAVTIAVGHAPYGIALTPDGRKAYVANAGSNSVSVVDTQAHVVTETIAVGENPYGVAVAPGGERVYVTNQAAGSLTVIDGATSTFTVGSAPMGVAVSPDGQTAYVVDNDAHSLILVDAYAGEVTKTIPVGKHPAHVAITPDGAQAYVTNAAGGSVSVVDLWTATVTETLLVSDHPIGVGVGADGRFAFVTALDGSLLAGTVTIIDIATGDTETVRAGAPYGVAADPSGDYAYITDFRCQAVSMIDATDVDAMTGSGRGAHLRRPPAGPLRRSRRQDTSGGVAIQRGAYGVVADPDSGRAFVIHSDDDAIEVIDSVGHSTAVDVGRYPSAVALTRDGTRAYVTNYKDGSLSILDTTPASDSCNTVIGTLDVGLSWSTGVVLSSDGSRAYAVDQMDGHLSVIDTVADSASRDTVVNDIELGEPPTAVCIAPNQRWVYAINHFDHVVWAVHTVTKRTAAIRLPAYPYRISLSPNGLRLYASLCGDGSTCVIDTDPGSTRYQRVVSRLRVDGYGPDPVFSTAGARAYVVNSDANSVSVIDTPTSIVKNVAVGEYPWDVAVSPDGRRAYVVNNLDDSMSILRSATNSVTATIAVGARPCRVVVSADGDRAFVVNSRDDSVSVIDTETAAVSNTITVGSRPFDVAVSADGERAFVRHRDGLTLVAV